MGDGPTAGSSCAHLSIASSGEDQVGSDAPAAHLSRGSSSDQRARGGPAGSERLVLREHVPDRGGELAGTLDPGDLAAALATAALLCVLVPLAIGGMASGVGAVSYTHLTLPT